MELTYFEEIKNDLIRKARFDKSINFKDYVYGVLDLFNQIVKDEYKRREETHGPQKQEKTY